MEYAWKGIAGGSRGKILKTKNGSNGTQVEVKFDYGETRTVPLCCTIAETVWEARDLQPKE
jgi:hypothetical protein